MPFQPTAFQPLPYVGVYGPMIELYPKESIYPVKVGGLGRLIVDGRDSQGQIVTHYSVGKTTIDLTRIVWTNQAERNQFTPLMLMECPSPLTINLEEQSIYIDEICVVYESGGRQRFLAVSNEMISRILVALSDYEREPSTAKASVVNGLVKQANDPENIKAATDVLDAICKKNKLHFGTGIQALTELTRELVQDSIDQQFA